jgi:quercetin dioxygenase-like cupin family protein
MSRCISTRLPILLRGATEIIMALSLLAPARMAMAQATSRPCADAVTGEQPAGPACLLAHQELGSLPGTEVYWSLATYADRAAAQRDLAGPSGIIEAFGNIWLWRVGAAGFRPAHGRHVAEIGPVPVSGDVAYDAELLMSTFSPGMTAPVHVHSGPEAFYAVSGDTCLETPDGVRIARGAGSSLVIPGGPPMLLMNVGQAPRKGFALILHARNLPPTTLVHDWTPKGLCQAVMR